MQYFLDRKTLIRSIFIIAAPAILEMALNTMLMVADTLMVSKMVGNEALSAVGIVNSIFFLLIFVFSSFNTGAIALLSRSYGEKDMNKVDQYAGNNLSLNLAIGAMITLAAIITRDFLFMPYDITPEVLANAKSYYSILVVGMMFQFGSFAFASMSRGVEDTRSPMYITGFVNIFNILFNYLLIKGVGVFPEWGLQGAAVATTMARIVAFFLYLALFTSGKHKIKLKKATLKIKSSVVGSLWRISWPGAIEQLLMQTSFLFMGIIVSMLDTSSEALFRILISIESTSFMPAVGISIATATLVGKSLGEKDIEKAADTGYLATAMGTLWGMIAAIVFWFFPEFILSLFTDEASLFEAGILVFKVMAINQLFLTAYIVLSGALRGAGDTNAIMRLTSMRLWLVFVPMAFVLIRFFNMGVEAIWYAEITSFVIFLSFLFIRFHSRHWANINL